MHPKARCAFLMHYRQLPKRRASASSYARPSVGCRWEEGGGDDVPVTACGNGIDSSTSRGCCAIAIRGSTTATRGTTATLATRGTTTVLKMGAIACGTGGGHG